MLLLVQKKCVPVRRDKPNTRPARLAAEIPRENYNTHS